MPGVTGAGAGACVPNNALTLQPGGVAEMFYGIEHEQIVLAPRKRFCKIALQTDACRVPCYACGVNET